MSDLETTMFFWLYLINFANEKEMATKDVVFQTFMISYENENMKMMKIY